MDMVLACYLCTLLALPTKGKDIVFRFIIEYSRFWIHRLILRVSCKDLLAALFLLVKICQKVKFQLK
jgi:hypothetical protein